MIITSLEQISMERPLYIYGASSYGKSVLAGLRESGFKNIRGFIDTYRSGHIDDLPIIRFVKYIDNYSNDDQIFIASMYRREIETKLLSYGIIDYYIDPSHNILEISPMSYDPKITRKHYIDGEEEFLRIGGWSSEFNLTYTFCLNVWGESFLSLFYSVSLPSMLSRNNLPGLAEKARVRLYLFMKRDEAEVFKASPLFEELRRSVDVTLTHIRIPPSPDDPNAARAAKYGMLYKLYMYYYDTVESKNPDAVLGFLSPDMVMSDGYIVNSSKRIDEGYRGVYAPELVVDKSRFMPLIPTDLYRKDASSLCISARKLVGLAFRSLHRANEIEFINAAPFHRTACRFFWRVQEEGAVLHTYHMHHFMIRPRKRVRNFKAGFDHDFFINTIGDEDQIYAPADTDEMIHVNITPWNMEDETIPQFDIDALAEFTAPLIPHEMQRKFFRRPCRVHYEPCSEELWRLAETESSSVIERLIAAAMDIGKKN